MLLAVLVAAALLIAVGPIPRAPSAAAPRLPRVGYLGYTSPAGAAPYMGAFRPKLADPSLVEGRDVVIVERYAEGRYERLGDLAGNLMRDRAGAIVTPGPGPTPAPTPLTTTRPPA